jgi:hypothetical protein
MTRREMLSGALALPLLPTLESVKTTADAPSAAINNYKYRKPVVVGQTTLSPTFGLADLNQIAVKFFDAHGVWPVLGISGTVYGRVIEKLTAERMFVHNYTDPEGNRYLSLSLYELAPVPKLENTVVLLSKRT